MRQRMERLVILPFSAGCISEASVAVGIPQPRRSRSVSNTQADAIKGSKGIIEDSDILSGESMKMNSMRFLDNVPKPNISNGFNRLFKGFKNISQLFVEKDDDDEELEDLEMDMEIGCPTNVQHVTHIGWDGITTTTSSSSSSADSMIRGWNNLIPPELLALSAHQSLHQLDEEHVSNLDPDEEQLVEVVATSSSPPMMKDHPSIIN